MRKRYLLKIGNLYLKRNTKIEFFPRIVPGQKRNIFIKGDYKITKHVDKAYMFASLSVVQGLADELGGKAVEVTFKVEDS